MLVGVESIAQGLHVGFAGGSWNSASVKCKALESLAIKQAMPDHGILVVWNHDT